MTMKERLRSRVAELTSIIGVSGHEWNGLQGGIGDDLGAGMDAEGLGFLTAYG